MKPVILGNRGPAVEDIQRRLTALGHDLGASGVDGVFLDDTVRAVRAFQESEGLHVDGAVGPRTWSALVDSTFSFGDRMLYLRAPFFHGNDVIELQRALNALGFNCGPVDGIFGGWTERAVTEFQSNYGLGTDGVVGPDTYAGLNFLRHIWSSRTPEVHSQASGGPVDRSSALSQLALHLVYHDGLTKQIARRIENLARASHAACRVSLTDCSAGSVGIKAPASDSQIAVLIELRPTVLTEGDLQLGAVEPGVVAEVALLPDRRAMTAALQSAVSAGERRRNHIVITIGNESFTKGSKQGFQKASVAILDAVCTVFGE